MRGHLTAPAIIAALTASFITACGSTPAPEPEAETQKHQEPSLQDLSELTPEAIEIPDSPSPADTDEDKAAQFALATTTWDTTEDSSELDSYTRAASLMLPRKADAMATREPSHYQGPSWDTHAGHDAVSYPWLTDITPSTNHDGREGYTMAVCWAWISDSRDPVIEGPRQIEAYFDADGQIIGHSNGEIDDESACDL
ncbi:hypothetical protein [Nesterenkonia sp. K-15-9-6]|uniref:hypothetical protein n=1 Tax=Nesterenkonia sp. K-15-9-6 TaxID=3093918 RepID=UPI004044270E